ncbi:OsmC family peroxiredoxin [Mucilaginibacter limnophilus]|uniref:OsmC family peroxiredoxin n=1 Tax=Mucilaginibacter limnophilus TaxID=1932778 RepID=A0A437MT55_9SPHI|nr:OsmC family protein [Mucilaginibacter limnophilus]RVU00833.1 OsmC family peroxiredoxin [Mucilaginibacter limnophilus]
MIAKKEPVLTATSTTSRAKYQTLVHSRNHTVIVDEPHDKGGEDTGMDPFGLLLASLGSCTGITLRMYIDRKMWVVDEIIVDLELFKTDLGTLIERKITFKGELIQEQLERLVEIANLCPIHKILCGDIDIKTTAFI